MWVLRSGLLWAVVLCLGISAEATQTLFWQVDSYAEFSAGRTDRLSISHDGRIMLAPEFAEVANTEQPYILSAVRDAAGHVYVGTGHEGKVYRLDADGKLHTVYDAEEPDIFALAVSGDGTLYIGASPGGKIYAVTPAGDVSPFQELDSRYIWDLGFDAKGVLYAATGVEGKIYRITGDSVEVLFDATQMHVMSLAWDLSGRLLAGTSPDGYVYSIAADGTARSLFDAPHQEIRQLALDRYGRIYVLGVGKEATEGDGGANAADAEAVVAAVLSAASGASPKSRRKNSGSVDLLNVGQKGAAAIGGLYRIDRQMNVETLWYANDSKAFAFEVLSDGKVLLGTDERSRILALENGRFLATLAESPQEQVTRLLSDGNDLLVFTSNLGRIYRLAKKKAPRGEFLSAVEDTEFMSRLGRLQAHYAAREPAVRCEFHVRSGNTAEPDATWSHWTDPLDPSADENIPLGPARYFQVKTVLLDEDQAGGQAEPWVEEIVVSYRQQNQMPRLSGIDVNPPGVVFQETPQVASNIGLPEYGARSTLALPGYVLAGLSSMTGQITRNKVYEAGSISLSWTAWDPNNDQLEYEVHIRPAGSDTWSRLADGLREPLLNVRRESIADGKYLFKVVASDAPSNSGGEAQSDFLLSKLVIKDATPPRLVTSEPEKIEAGFRFRLAAEDQLSPIYSAEFSGDGGETWQAVFPRDTINDQLQEQYEVVVTSPAPQVRLVLVRVMDYAGNLAVTAVAIP
ncbi:MAG: hypothetical protein JXQ27_08350 [Acidobacteria bacterium]|nr:hypothetical protein [Acidobacteriota bacterium]